GRGAGRSGPARRWSAPYTPPPPGIRSLAALTMASTARPVMSPKTIWMGVAFPSDAANSREYGARRGRQPFSIERGFEPALQARELEDFESLGGIEIGPRGVRLDLAGPVRPPRGRR